MDRDFEIIDDDNYQIANIIATQASPAIRELGKFLNDSGKFITEKGDATTNIINRIDGRTYCFPDSELETFFNKTEATRKERVAMHFLERQNENFSGIMIDFDRYQTSKRSEFTEDMFQALSFHVSRLLVEILDFTGDHILGDNGRLSINIFYTQKPKPMPATANPMANPVANPVAPANANATPATANAPAPTLYRDGIHMLIPHIMISRRTKRYLIDQLITTNVLAEVFERLECLEESHNKMLDGNSAHVPVMFYGCSKPSAPAYSLVAAHEVAVNPKSLMFAPMIKPINYEKLMQDPSFNIMYELSLSFNIADTDTFAPLFKRYKLQPKIALAGTINTNAEQHRGEVINDGVLNDTRNDISVLSLDDPDARYIKTALDVLTPDYATNYDKWLNVIIALASCGERYKPFAMYFSMRCPEKYNGSSVSAVWERARAGNHTGAPLTRNSIYYWAKLCNPTRYREMFNTVYYKVLRQCAFEDNGKIEDGKVAKLLHVMLGDKFVVDERTADKVRKPYWFEFVTENQEQKRGQVYKWREETSPDTLYKYIQDKMPLLYQEVERDIKSELEKAEDERVRKYLKDTLKQMQASRIKLNNHNFCKNVLASATNRFRVRGFCDDLDQNGDVMGVGNGILKLGSKAELIEGYNEYRVSKYTDTVYVEFDPTNHYIAKTLDIIQQIIPEPDVLEYVMMFLSTGLDGRAAAPLMLMLDGGGANGKTTLFEWVRNTLGSYGYKAPMNLLTDAREKGSSANSAFIGLKDMRLAVYSEADDVEGEIFVNGGRFKEMISPEIQSGRDLHQRQENFKITATQVVAFNKRLSFRSNDHAIWRRVRYYKCKVKFCSDPDPNNRYEQKEDSRIAEQYPLDPYYRSAMMAILVHYNERLRREYGGNIKLVPCHTIDVETEEYRNTQDTLNLYITQMMVVPVGEPLFEDQMHGNTFEYPLHVVLASYKKWYVERKGREAPECGVEIFDSSRMAKYIRRDINGAQMLVGLRIRESLNENLRTDEKFLINLVPIRVNEVAEFARAKPQDINIVRDADEYANLERGNIGPIVDVKNIVQLGIFNEGDDDDDDFI